MDAITPEFEEIEICDFGGCRSTDGAIDETGEKATTRKFQDFLQDGQPQAGAQQLSRREGRCPVMVD